MKHVLALCFVGHAFAEKRRKIALREYKKLLKKTGEEQRPLQSSKKNDRPHLTGSSRVPDATLISKQVCIKQTELILCISRTMFT